MKKKILIMVLLISLTGCQSSNIEIPTEQAPEIVLPNVDIPVVNEEDTVDDTLEKILANYIYIDVINLDEIILPSTILDHTITWTNNNKEISSITGTNETYSLTATLGKQEKYFEITFENSIVTSITQQELNFYYNFLTDTNKIGGTMSPNIIVIHNTGNNATAENEVKYLTASYNTSSTSYHFAVDDTSVYQAMPLNLYAHHAGDLTVNKTSIGIEIAKSTSTDVDVKDQCISNGQKLIKLLQMQYQIETLMTHYDVNGKYCPHDILDRYGIDLFYEELIATYNEI